jgi:opacity protein-like surface antigen
MKRLSAALLSLAASGAAFAAHGPFTGVYGGANIGVMQIETYNNFAGVATTAGVPTDTLSVQPKASDMSANAGLALGYTFRIEGLFIAGLEGRANFEDIDVHYDNTLISGLPNNPSVVTNQTKLELENELALLLKLGLMMDTNVLLYGLVGPDWGNFEVKPAFYNSSLNLLRTGKQSNYKSGLLLGLGMEYLVTRCTSIAFEYNYVDYGHLNDLPFLSAPIPNTNDLLTLSNDIHARTNKFAVNFNFYFG